MKQLVNVGFFWGGAGYLVMNQKTGQGVRGRPRLLGIICWGP